MRIILCSFLAVLAVLCTGCGSSGTSGGVTEETPAGTYSGLNNQLVGVMVWADWGTRTEYNQIQLDLARSIQYKLEERLPKPEQKETDKEQKEATLRGTRFVDSRSVVRYQREHPEIDGQPIQAVAPKLGVDRVIYVEIESFQAQSPETILLLKGRAKATLRVAEVTPGATPGTGTAKVVFEERGITAGYPPNAPEGVVASDRMNVETVYRGTVSALADRIVARFVENKGE
jgi:hypothetical protein